MISYFQAEIKKYLIELKTYYPDHLVEMIITFFIFAILIIINKFNNSQSVYIGFIYWYLLSSLISEASVSISTEKQMGTLEQLLIKPIKFEYIILIKSLVWFLINFLKVQMIFLIIKMIFQINLFFDFRILLIFCISSVGILGFTLFLVGLTLKYTKVASFESLISYFLLFFSGAIIDDESLPKWAIFVGDILPIKRGIQLSTNIVANNHINFIEILLFVLQAIIYFSIGFLTFNSIYLRSKDDGIDRSY
ncbi:ABC transporter permease [Ignavigranum ruoffiae]|uniref:ABC-2 type transport system permease protein n=1 Tax=Ignavigranum ruoffiae TaxID=89093 RepID=A0A1H8ZB05_9LACT|nr:ABC transporter permease [Ignavigranum ruoffiae]UPQ85537.1 ABC transporter permease [Ignavigranum ruoffiae]SEP61553.1 ABC-2 type transport system permease protein [Ignavigranum ruoffiae]